MNPLFDMLSPEEAEGESSETFGLDLMNPLLDEAEPVEEDERA